ncbi:hypothetical protein Hdeb2414_s0020g00567211 [Helianthus debilis subsp. tardiflorus]
MRFLGSLYIETPLPHTFHYLSSPSSATHQTTMCTNPPVVFNFMNHSTIYLNILVQNQPDLNTRGIWVMKPQKCYGNSFKSTHIHQRQSFCICIDNHEFVTLW